MAHRQHAGPVLIVPQQRCAGQCKLRPDLVRPAGDRHREIYRALRKLAAFRYAAQPPIIQDAIAALPGRKNAVLFRVFFKAMPQPALFAGKPALYWIAIGKTDFLYQQNADLRRYLDEKGYPYEYVETEGGHIWRNWRIYLTQFAQKIFK